MPEVLSESRRRKGRELEGRQKGRGVVIFPFALFSLTPLPPSPPPPLFAPATQARGANLLGVVPLGVNTKLPRLRNKKKYKQKIKINLSNNKIY